MSNSQNSQQPETNIQLIQSGSILKLNQTESIDLTGLSELQVNELKVRYANDVLDLKRQAEEMKIGIGALDASLSSFNSQTDSASRAGHSSTIQHSQTSQLGRTEVIIGNTDKAAEGRLSRSATGEKDNTLKIVLIVAGVILILALLVSGR